MLGGIQLKCDELGISSIDTERFFPDSFCVLVWWILYVRDG